MSVVHVAAGQAKVGTIDGVCAACGSPRRRMGWLNYPDQYWLMCTVSMQPEDHCDLPTEPQARRRLRTAP